jgi:4-amino-4-deoxy-L-arabinose transferase-like glycosyltransferase
MQPRMKAAVIVVSLACALRLVVAGFTGLGIDESYMVAASNHFAPSYFDHPLAAWWLELAFRDLFGTMAPIVVRLPFVLLSAVSSWLLYLLTDRLYGARPAFWAVVAYSISPVFSLAFGCWVLPDGPLDAALLAAAYAFSRAIGIGGAPAPRWWWAAGFFAGLAMLSKYSAALVLAGALLVMLTDPAARRQWRCPDFWGALILVGVMCTPILLWNAAHGWQSFHYQGGRAAFGRLHPWAPLKIWGGEALFVLPWIWLPEICLMVAALARGPKERRGWMLSLLAIIPVLLFSVVGIWSQGRILYHWASPGYLLLLPMLGNCAAAIAPGWRNFVAQLSGLLLAGAAILITAELNLGFLPRLDVVFAPAKSPLLQAVDWDTINAAIPPGIGAVAALRWYDAGKIGYALRGRLPVTVFGGDPHEFGISTPPSSLLGKTILLIAMPGNVTDVANTYAPDFRDLKPGPALVVAHLGDILLVIPTLIGTDLLMVPK